MATTSVDQVTGYGETVAYKAPCRLATTGNIVLSGLQAIDGSLTAVNDRVLVKDQTDASQNGIYIAASSAWVRAVDMDSNRDVASGTQVLVVEGATNAGPWYIETANPISIGTTPFNFAFSFDQAGVDAIIQEAVALAEAWAIQPTDVTPGNPSAKTSAAAAAASTVLTGADVVLTHADVVTAAAALASTQAARDASLYGKGIFPTTAAAIGLGIAATGAITAGSGGTNGTFALAFTGGTGSGAAGRFVVAGGVLTQIIITAPGSYTVAPTLSFAASAGLTGAAAAAILGNNVDVGEYFWAPVTTGVLGLYNVTAGPVATDTNVRASTVEVLNLIGSSVAGPVAITGAGTALANSNVYYWPTSLATFDQYLDTLQTGMGTTGVLNMVMAHLEGDGTLSLISVTPVNVATGASSLSGLSILKPAGAVMGVQLASGTWYYTTGTIPNGEFRWDSALPTSHTAKNITTTNGPQWKATFVGEVTGKARLAAASVARIDQTLGTSQDIGWPSLVNTGTDTPANYSVVLQTPAPADGYITEVNVGAAGNGAANIHVIDYLGGLTVNVLSTTPVTLQNGVAKIPLGIAIPAGKYAAISGGGYKYQANNNPLAIHAWIKSGVLSNGAAVLDSAAHRYEVRFKIKTAVLADTDRALAGSAGNAGLALLANADPSGVADATALFASASSAHPNPYVPPGSFALTAMPASGDGFWGPGKPFVGGRRFFVPRRPSLQNLYDGFRAKMAEHIANNDVLCLIADSIGHWALASAGPAHWFNRVTQFVNIGIADDEPGMTALRPSSTYVPTFYGVTVAGSVSTGTRGPIGESIILADGASLAFTGAYEQVDVHYTQDAAQGSIIFAFNGGAAYKTVSAAGSLALDQYTGPSLTGQAASGNYTVTAVGGPVEITGLIRLGIKAAGSRPRLRTLRASHGSYTFASFNSTRLASAIAQASYAGGKIVPVLALGINDSFGTAPSSISATITTILNTLEAAGAPRIIVMPPTRPNSSWDGSYTGGRTYDAALGAIRQNYRSRNVLAVPIDGFDYINSGNYQEGLHFNDAGHDGNALRFIETVAERG